MSRRVVKFGVIVAAGVGVAVLYALQLVSPLRLDADAMDYLVVAASLADGGSLPDYWGEAPPGYPVLIALLLRGGLGHSAGLVGLNVVCLALGLFAVGLVSRRAFGFDCWTLSLISLLALLSWVVVKYTTLPLSELPYFGVSMWALLALSVAEDERRALPWLATVVLTIGAMLIRTVGIAFIPAMLWAWYRAATDGRRRPLTPRRRWDTQLTISASVVAVVWMGMVGVAKTQQLYVLTHDLYPQGLLHGLLKGLGFKLQELGELAINVPMSKIPAFAHPAYPVIGGLLLVVLGYSLWLRRRGLRAADVYTGTYLAIIFGWSYKDARFWLPVLPLLMSWVAVAVKRFDQPWLQHGALVAYLTMFSLQNRRMPHPLGCGGRRPRSRRSRVPAILW